MWKIVTFSEGGESSIQVVRYPLLPVGSVHFLSDSAIVAAGMHHYHPFVSFMVVYKAGMETNHYLVFCFISGHDMAPLLFSRSTSDTW